MRRPPIAGRLSTHVSMPCPPSLHPHIPSYSSFSPRSHQSQPSLRSCHCHERRSLRFLLGVVSRFNPLWCCKLKTARLSDIRVEPGEGDGIAVLSLQILVCRFEFADFSRSCVYFATPCALAHDVTRIILTAIDTLALHWPSR